MNKELELEAEKYGYKQYGNSCGAKQERQNCIEDFVTGEQENYIEALDFDLMKVLKSKGKDYADVDVLSNFKIVSKIVKLSKIDATLPEGYAMLMVILKIVRIWNLKEGGKTPENESLLDSYKDLINYCKLSYLCEIENK